ncbi:MAG TPA: toll/interleukin-1 receptor domain-containing protein [Albitalea sp.]|jgi:hypothetical protein|nr:toll/interleukin-1 receptor domain-containing protein [Albitalea sp.]
MPAQAAKGVFISYSRQDRDLVTLAARLLRAGGATVFLDVSDIADGDKWEAVLLKAIAGCERIMVFWSAAAAASRWVEREWRTALSLNKRIVPLILDATPLPPQLAEFQGVPDLVAMLEEARRGAPPPSAAHASSTAPPPARLRLPWWPVAASLGAVTMVAVFWAVYRPGGPHSLPDQPSSVTVAPSAASSASAAAMAPAEGAAWSWAAALLVMILVAAWVQRRRRRRRAATPDLASRFTERLFDEG